MVIESSMKIEDSVTVTGLRRSKAWADDQYVYFVIKFSKPFKRTATWKDEIITGNRTENEGKN